MAVVSREVGCAVLAAGLALFLFGSPAFAVDVPPPEKKAEEGTTGALPQLKPLTGHKMSPREGQKQLLSVLYDQLERAKSEDSAELIVGAIEKLWARSGSDTIEILMERASTALKSRNYPLATKLLAAVTEVEPAYVTGWSQLATVHFMQNDYSAAMQKLRYVLALDPRHFKAIEGLSIILRETGHKKAALKVVRKALEIHPHLTTAKQAEQELTREVEGQGI